MGQITITLPPELEKEIEEDLSFGRDDEELSELVREALSTYLGWQRNELQVFNPDRPYKSLRFPPASPGSGVSDASINHDRYLAEAIAERKPARRSERS